MRLEAKYKNVVRLYDKYMGIHAPQDHWLPKYSPAKNKFIFSAMTGPVEFDTVDDFFEYIINAIKDILADHIQTRFDLWKEAEVALKNMEKEKT